MNITKTQSDSQNIAISIEINKADYAPQVEKELKNYQKKAVVKGFRQGKTPMAYVQKMYGSSIKVDEINKVLGKALMDYIKENNLVIFGEPLPSESQQPLSLENDDHVFMYDIALQPEVNISLDKVSVPYYKITVTDEMTSKQIGGMRENAGEMQPVEEVEGSEFIKGVMTELDENGAVKEGGVQYDAASFSMINMKDEDAQKAFKGAKIDQEVKFDAAKAFPNKTDFATMLNIKKEEVENIGNMFSFVVKEIKRLIPAEENQAFYDKIYGEGNVKSAEEFKEKVKVDIESQLKGHSDYRLTIDIREKLLSMNADVQLPEAFLKRWMLTVNKNVTADELEKDFSNYIDEFKWQVIKSAIARANDIKLGEEDMKAVARQIAAAQLQQYGLVGLSDEQLDGFAAHLLKDEKQRDELMERALENRVFAATKAAVTLKEKSITMEKFQELFKK